MRLWPKILETLAELQNRRPQEQVRDIPVEVLASNPTLVNLDAATFTKCLASPPSGSAPGPGGCTYEMLKLCLDVAETSHLLFRAAEDLARAQALECITRASMGADDDSFYRNRMVCVGSPQAHRSAGCCEDAGPF